jgi:dTDP-glucose 4,6-dehydratase
MKTRVLITGGAGFIGSHLIEHTLLTTDWDIVVLDGLTYAGDVARMTDSIYFDPSRVEVHWHDLRSPMGKTLKKKIGHIDYIINMASNSHVENSLVEPVTFIHSNVMLVCHMLEYAREVKPKKFIQVSTDEVYGNAPDGYSHKEWDVIAPSNPYAGSKAAQEAIAYSYWRSYGTPIAITNTMNNFGERQDCEKFVPMVVKKLLNGEVIQVHAEPIEGATDYESQAWKSGSRVWLHARNHADALIWMLKNVDFNHHPKYERLTRYNVAGEREIGNDEIVEMVAKILNVEPKMEYLDFHSSRPGHDLRYSLDGTKLAQDGWVAPLTIDESFEKAVLWTVENKHWLE